MAPWRIGTLTPGRAGQSAHYPVFSDNGLQVAIVFARSSIGSQDAHARLVAAAPLLEHELKHALDMMILRCGDDQATIDRFRAALAHCSLDP